VSPAPLPDAAKPGRGGRAFFLGLSRQAARLLIQPGRQVTALGSQLVEEWGEERDQSSSLGQYEDTDGTCLWYTQGCRETPSATFIDCGRGPKLLGKGEDLTLSLIERCCQAFDGLTIQDLYDFQPLSPGDSLSSRQLGILSDLLEYATRQQDVIKEGREKLKLANASQRDQRTGVDDERHA